MQKQISVLECTCDKCQYRWQPRLAVTPRICPRCKSPRWDGGGPKPAPPVRAVEREVRTVYTETNNVDEEFDFGS